MWRTQKIMGGEMYEGLEGLEVEGNGGSRKA